MIKYYFLIVIGIAMASSCANTKQTTSNNFVESAFKISKQHLENAIVANPDLTKFPRSINADGSLRAPGSSDWVSGFFPGNLWYIYEYSKDEKIKEAARKWTLSMEKEQFNVNTHDVGFMIYCCYGNAYRLTNQEDYKTAVINAAKSLSTRFNKKIGCIQSWDWPSRWKFPVIIDNMMNLELLYAASKLTGDTSYRDIANHHAFTSMKNHFREDYSSFHVIDYDPETGEVYAKKTHQGYADKSAWARGQGWGLYGYTVCYRETKNEKFLEQAKKIAALIMNHPNTPEDLIPYWDYNAPDIPNAPRDASAAALFASALLELSTYDAQNSKAYFKYAEQILKNLSSPEYLAEPGTNHNFILKHSTGNKPNNSEIDVPLAYADYYYLEALLRYQKLTTN
ncbi:MAG: glycoside hydrolase family 88 protein [Labilibaculum sp.]|nr:glycoside hydrolase family 88 protein [Labilibaculum sp.]MBI9057335.1 glycoside hydrolase family 88 protein [Labilibaculum sp.]